MPLGIPKLAVCLSGVGGAEAAHQPSEDLCQLLADIHGHRVCGRGGGGELHRIGPVDALTANGRFLADGGGVRGGAPGMEILEQSA